MKAYLARAAREHPFTAHRYDLADFGLDVHDVRDRFAGYTARFLA
jgi:hypothetical protein